jgi:hypothetical protein
MAYSEDSTDAAFRDIAEGAKKSPKFQEMTGDGEDPDADDAGPSEVADLAEAFEAAQSGDAEAFKASMLSAIKSCIANYGAKPKGK